MAAPKIVSCEIGPYPKFLMDRMPEVTATFDNGETKRIFWFYPDELSFSEEEFIGLTEAEARRLKFEKDRSYLMDWHDAGGRTDNRHDLPGEMPSPGKLR